MSGIELLDILKPILEKAWEKSSEEKRKRLLTSIVICYNSFMKEVKREEEDLRRKGWSWSDIITAKVETRDWEAWISASLPNGRTVTVRLFCNTWFYDLSKEEWEMIEKLITRDEFPMKEVKGLIVERLLKEMEARIKEQEEKLREKDRKIAELREELRKLEKENAELREKLSQAISKEEAEELRKRIAELQEELREKEEIIAKIRELIENEEDEDEEYEEEEEYCDP